MKKLITVLLILTITFAAAYTYVKLFVHPPFGPIAILIVSLLGCASFFWAITLLLYLRGDKKKLAKMWLSVIAVVVTYAIAELVASSLFLQTLSPPMITDQYRHHKLVPNTRTRFKSREYTYIQNVNNIGLRGSDIQLKPAQNSFRIVMLGDSFTMGKGVKDDKTFSALLEKSLNTGKERINHKQIEVFNAGVDSYSPILSFFQLTKDLGSLEPNLVVLNLDMSDLVQETAYRKRATYKSDGEIIGVDGEKGRKQKPLSKRVRDWGDRNLYITRLILYYLEQGSAKLPEITVENVVIRPNLETLKHTLADDKTDRKEQWHNLFDSILKIKNYCDQNRIEFLLTIYPWGHQISNKEWVPGRFAFIPDKSAVVSDKSIKIIQEFATNKNIQFLNVFPAFRSYKGGSRLYYNEDMHWTELGNGIMAEELEQYIRVTYFKDYDQNL